MSGWDSRIEKEIAIRYLNLVPILYSYKDSPNRKWLVLYDDNTFFITINSLIERFKQYNHIRLLYIGILSEDITAVKVYSSQAFRGGGVFLSRPLAEIVSSRINACRTRAKIKQSNTG